MTVYDEIRQERERQDRKHGGPAHDDKHTPEEWLRFIRAQESYTYRVRLIRVAALAVAAIESFDRLIAPGANPQASWAHRMLGFYTQGKQEMSLAYRHAPAQVVDLDAQSPKAFPWDKPLFWARIQDLRDLGATDLADNLGNILAPELWNPSAETALKVIQAEIVTIDDQSRKAGKEDLAALHRNLQCRREVLVDLAADLSFDAVLEVSDAAR